MEQVEAIRPEHEWTPVWLQWVLRSRSIEKVMNVIEKKLHDDARGAPEKR